MKNKFITTLLFFCFAIKVFSQDAQENMNKYWYYRFRLLNDFMLVGDCQGCSLPAKTILLTC